MMNDTLCAYDGRRDDVLVAYLYDDIDPAERQAFSAHLTTCAVCRSELQALAEVRDGLAGWLPPEVADGVGGSAPKTRLKLVEPPRRTRWRAIADAPIWAQAAAAMLVVAASLGLANLDVSYSRDGLKITTGWMRPANPPAQSALVSVQPQVAPWRPDLTALERQLRQDLGSKPVPVVTAVPAPNEEAVMKRVRALLEESERRQQRELALRVAEVARDGQVQRQADLVRIDRMLGLMQSRTGVEVMRTQQQLNTLAQRVSEQR